jgi:hypothetical protein
MARRKSIGLGDTIDKITTATGIKAAVKFIAGEDCKCDERKEKLNQLFPYKKNECLTESEYNKLNELFAEIKATNSVQPSQQAELIVIHDRIFGTKSDLSMCASCVRDLVNALQQVYDLYK